MIIDFEYKYKLEQYLSNLKDGSKIKIDTLTDKPKRFKNAVIYLKKYGMIKGICFSSDFLFIKQQTYDYP